jgi:hypothetical protein
MYMLITSQVLLHIELMLGNGSACKRADKGPVFGQCTRHLMAISIDRLNMSAAAAVLCENCDNYAISQDEVFCPCRTGPYAALVPADLLPETLILARRKR